jgi:hypothetical protein
MKIDGSKPEHAAIELHDSEVATIQLDGATLTICFTPACLHRSAGMPGVDSGTCWTQDAVMVLRGAQLWGDQPELPCTLSGGFAVLGEECYENLIPMEMAQSDAVKVHLTFDDGSEIHATADGFELHLVGSASYQQDYPGSMGP